MEVKLAALPVASGEKLQLELKLWASTVEPASAVPL